MYVYGLHRNQLFDPPNSSGLRSLTNLEFDGCLKEICSCAGNVLRLCRVWRELPEPETLREEYQENCRAADSQAFTVFAGWKTYFLDPVEAEATRRYGLEHESEESYTPKHSELRTILGDLQEILHTRDEDPKPQMFAISAFEAWFSCFLARTQDIALVTLVEELKSLLPVTQSRKSLEVGQPRMLHLTFATNIRAERLAVVGYTGCKLKTGYQPFDEWSKERRMECMDLREREQHSRHRVQAIERLHALREDELESQAKGGAGGASEEDEKEVKWRLAVWEACRVDNLPKGSQNTAIALSYPRLIVRNRCFICMSTSRWSMHQEDPIEEAIKKEVESRWCVQVETEMQCAEVETEIQVQRLKDQAILQSSPLDLVSRSVATKHNFKGGEWRGIVKGYICSLFGLVVSVIVKLLQGLLAL